MDRVRPRLRAFLEAQEEERLAPYATLSRHATRRHPLSTPDPEEDYRTHFARDRDRILHARAFRRLKHKTQVYVPHTADHPRTRLTHTLEVAQLSRTIARALGLNEDLAEAIALGHDLGHTPFGHSGEKVLARILRGEEPTCPLPPALVAEVGTFKHNYHSLRVVDLLEQRYPTPGLNLTDQVREGILKHTSWTPDLPFPLPNREGLRWDRPCHLEGQVVALADEIAQQTHDLEDGLANEAVNLPAVERLGLIQRAIAVLGATYAKEPSAFRRAAGLQRTLIHLLVTDTVRHSAGQLTHLAQRHRLRSREDWQAFLADEGPLAVGLSPQLEPLFAELRGFIYQFIINHQEVNLQDHRAHLVVTGLFRAYYLNPLTLPAYVLRRFAELSGRPYLRDVPLSETRQEVQQHYLPNPLFVRVLVDHLAGMSDRFALAEYESLYHPRAGSW
ncbi:MAG: dNTP triphosphohydrolase [Thermoanaerobaculum sp.]|nr:dNTP triphosphohydrolase [Thermoanaerobaculum sp.]MDW7966864.1 dNTP triphosphohydrolase [Thermoanaerobaculum sp.]